MLRYHHELFGKSTFDTVDCTRTIYFDEQNTLKCSFALKSFEEGFYAFKIPIQIMHQKFPTTTYFLAVATGCFLNESKEPAIEGVENTVLVDSDYDSDCVFGVYFTSALKTTDGYCGNMSVNVKNFYCPEDDVEFYSKTQSPVFNSAAFPAVSHFHSLYRSTDGANGYDVVLMNMPQDFIEPMGNLVLDMNDTVDTRASGSFLLRSRFSRCGLSIQYGAEPGLFTITNNSSFRVLLPKRIFQYVPLSNFNGKVCNTNNIIHTSCSFKTVEDNMDEYETQYKFGHIVTNSGKKRQAKC